MSAEANWPSRTARPSESTTVERGHLAGVRQFPAHSFSGHVGFRAELTVKILHLRGTRIDKSRGGWGRLRAP